ncbi:hypothetical protein GPJ56_007230 [Histomonas meleagridis]|nr:hypothetical protein GPJ56_007230 [Histomonas meleagridis]
MDRQEAQGEQEGEAVVETAGGGGRHSGGGGLRCAAAPGVWHSRRVSAQCGTLRWSGAGGGGPRQADPGGQVSTQAAGAPSAVEAQAGETQVAARSRWRSTGSDTPGGGAQAVVRHQVWWHSRCVALQRGTQAGKWHQVQYGVPRQQVERPRRCSEDSEWRQ